MPMRVKFWGVRGSTPTPGPATAGYGGNTSCVEVRTPGAHFICDAGSGIRELGIQLSQMAEGAPVRTNLLLSHAHWDHIQGFPFFSPVYNPTTILRVFGTEPGDDRFFRLLSGQMNSDYFPVQFADLAGQIVADHLGGGCRVVGDTEVSFLPVRHPGGCLAYRFRLGDEVVVYATDTELDEGSGESEGGGGRGGLRALPADMVEFVRGADLLICDGQYTDEEYRSRVGWGHSRATTVVDLAVVSDVKRVAIFHHDPMQSDEDVDAKIAACHARARLLGRPDLTLFGAREGAELQLG